MCQVLGVDLTLATALACLLTVAVNAQSAASGDDQTSSTRNILQVLRIGADRNSVRESLRGVPGERVTAEDLELVELRPFRIFRSGEIIAYDNGSVGDEHEKLEPSAPIGAVGTVGTVPSSGDLRYGRIVAVGENSSVSGSDTDTGIRRLTIKTGASGVAGRLSTEVYSFKSAREVSAFAPPSTAKSSNSAGSGNTTSSTNKNGNTKPSATTTTTNTNSSSSNGTQQQDSVHGAIDQRELLGAVHSLLTRAGIPASLEQQELISRIVGLEGSVKRSELELQAER